MMTNEIHPTQPRRRTVFVRLGAPTRARRAGKGQKQPREPRQPGTGLWAGVGRAFAWLFRLPAVLAGLALNWLEHGDLVPLLVLVSALHYADVLKGKDEAIAAIFIGLLVDLGHYRTVRAAVRYAMNGGKPRRKTHKIAVPFSRSKAVWKFSTIMPRGQGVLRFAIAGGMTAISLNYHERFYNDLWLSVPLPLLIAALAWLHKVDERTGKQQPRAVGRAAVQQAEQMLPAGDRVRVLEQPVHAAPLLPEQAGAATQQRTPAAAVLEQPYKHTCPCGYGTDNSKAFAGHARACSVAKELRAQAAAEPVEQMPVLTLEHAPAASTNGNGNGKHNTANEL